jgi:hypothetical protein
MLGPAARGRRAFRCVLALLAIVLLSARSAQANGADLPPQVLLQGFVVVAEGRLQLLLRVPLVLLGGFALPKRDAGYVDLGRADESLARAAAAAARQVELFENGVRLTPVESTTRLALPSDRSFQNYADALAHMQEPPLPIDTDLVWNQGFFDVALDYPVRSAVSRFSARVSVAPELGSRIKLHLDYLSPHGRPRAWDLTPSAQQVAFDPRWFEVARAFAVEGMRAPFDVERLVFLLCLVTPFRSFAGPLAIVLALSALQAVSLTVGAWGAAPDWRVMSPLFDAALAAAVLLLAIENVVAPSLRRRWLVACVVGVLGGFGLGHRLFELSQFAGDHTRVATVAFNVGVALGEIAALAIAAAAATLAVRYVLGVRPGTIILSALLGHAAWHWMLDDGHELQHAVGIATTTGSMAAIVWWTLLGFLVGGLAWFLPERFDAKPTPRGSAAGAAAGSTPA